VQVINLKSKKQWDILIELLSILIAIPSKFTTKFVKPTKSAFWNNQDYSNLQSSSFYQRYAKLLAFNLIEWFGNQTAMEQSISKAQTVEKRKNQDDKTDNTKVPSKKKPSKNEQKDMKGPTTTLAQATEQKDIKEPTAQPAPATEQKIKFNRLLWRPELVELLEVLSNDPDPMIAHKALSIPTWQISRKGKGKGNAVQRRTFTSRGRGRGQGRGRGRGQGPGGGRGRCEARRHR